MKALTTLVLLSCFSLPLHAAWQLDNNQSWLYYISIKAQDVGEINTFKTLAGTVDEQGKVELAIDLASVDTHIEIRDQRMKDFLFKTTEYAQATLSAQLDMTSITNIKVGNTLATTVEANLDLHGEKQTITTHLLVSRLADNKLLVSSQMPILVNSAAFKLVEGIEKLREIAGLSSISKVVPVTFALTFVMPQMK